MWSWMREGGAAMYGMVLIGAVTIAVASRASVRARRGTLFAGALCTLACGVLGIALGLQAVAGAVGRFSDPVGALLTGLREISYNGVLAAFLAAALTLAGLATAPGEGAVRT